MVLVAQHYEEVWLVQKRKECEPVITDRLTSNVTYCNAVIRALVMGVLGGTNRGMLGEKNVSKPGFTVKN